MALEELAWIVLESIHDRKIHDKKVVQKKEYDERKKRIVEMKYKLFEAENAPLGL